MIDAFLPDALGLCGLMPNQFNTLTPYEFEIMRNEKIELLRLSNPYLAHAENEHNGQSQDEQKMVIETANALFGGS